MATLASVLPAPRQQLLYGQQEKGATSSIPSMMIITKKKPPPYGSRKGWIPRSNEDFGDGGAFPEIHVAQFPLDMGRKSTASQKTVPLSVDAQGRIKYDAIINPGGEKTVFSRHDELVVKKVEEVELRRPDPDEEAATTERTREALERLVSGKIAAAQPSRVSSGKNSNEPTYIRYTPSQKGPQFNSGADHRIIRLTEMPTDPFEPPKFKHKKVPGGPPSPPVPVMHSPPRKVTVKDQQDWKIPPCISNWKNHKGYTIPLDKRLAADGRGLQETVINDNFAKFSESLYIAERTAREEVAKRAEIERLLKLKEKEKKEEMLRKLAQEARVERAVGQAQEEDADEDTIKARNERDEIREERRRERERDLRLQRNKSANARNLERDVTERIALGQAVPQPSQETMYDQRLFNQSQGLSSGFGDEEDYNVYTKPLFAGSSANTLYRPKKGADDDAYGNEEDMKKLLDTSKFKPDKDFSGVERNKEKKEERTGPVEFEKQEDPFGLDEFLSQAKKTSAKNALEKIGTSGHMHASAGNADGVSNAKRSRLEFESASKGKDNRDSSKSRRH